MIDYEKTFGSKLDTIIEIVSVNMPQSSFDQENQTLEILTKKKLIKTKIVLNVFLSIKIQKLSFVIISRSKINEEKNGPLIILESTAVTCLSTDTNYSVKKDDLDNLIIVDIFSL